MLEELEKITYEDIEFKDNELMLELEETLATGCGKVCFGCSSVK